jgi:hypothetical protein
LQQHAQQLHRSLSHPPADVAQHDCLARFKTEEVDWIDSWVSTADDQGLQGRTHGEAGDEAMRGEIVVPL